MRTWRICNLTPEISSYHRHFLIFSTHLKLSSIFGKTSEHQLTLISYVNGITSCLKILLKHRYIMYSSMSFIKHCCMVPLWVSRKEKLSLTMLSLRFTTWNFTKGLVNSIWPNKKLCYVQIHKMQIIQTFILAWLTQLCLLKNCPPFWKTYSGLRTWININGRKFIKMYLNQFHGAIYRVWRAFGAGNRKLEGTVELWMWQFWLTK